jgi:ABC-type branched-subunit amino acid transport system substrate-binding protein
VRPAFAAVLVLGLAASSGCTQARTVVIGVDLPLTGNDGAEGLMALHGIELAVADFHETPEGTRFQLAVRDTARGGFANPHEDEGSDNPDEPRNGIASLRAFAADARVVGVIGGLRPDVAAAEAPVARELELPVISPAAAIGTASWPVRSEPAFFALGFRDVDEAHAGALLARLLGYRRVAVLGDGGLAALAEDVAFSRFFSESGGTVVSSAGNRRYAGSAQAVFYKGPLLRAALLVPIAAAPSVLSPGERVRMAHRGYSAPITGVAFERVEPATRRSWFWDFANTTYVREFRRRYGAPPDEAALAGYDAFSVFLSALETAESSGRRDREGVVAALRAGPVATLRGRGSFNAAGLLRMDAFSAATVVCGRIAETRKIVPPRTAFVPIKRREARRRAACRRKSAYGLAALVTSYSRSTDESNKRRSVPTKRPASPPSTRSF